VYYLKSISSPARLELTSERKGISADVRRLFIEQYTIDKLSQYVTDDLKRVFPAVYKIDDVIFNDDIVRNINTTYYSYFLDGFWQDGDKTTIKFFKDNVIFKFEPISLYQELNITDCSKRKLDIEQVYPMNFTYVVEFILPQDIILIDDLFVIDNEAFYFEEKIEQLNKNTFQIEYKYNTKLPSINPILYLRICKEKYKILNRLPTLIYLKK
jgi:hypothetical protein